MKVGSTLILLIVKEELEDIIAIVTVSRVVLVLEQ